MQRLVVIGNGMVGHRFCERLVDLGLPERFADHGLRRRAPPRVRPRAPLGVLRGARRGGALAHHARVVCRARARSPARPSRGGDRPRTPRGRREGRRALRLRRAGARERIDAVRASDPRRRPRRRLPLPHDRRSRGDSRVGSRRAASRGDRRRAARARGREGGARPRARGPRDRVRRSPDAAPARSHAVPRCCATRSRRSACTCTWAWPPRPSSATSRSRALRFSDQPDLPVDLVIVSAGIRPRDDLARGAGLETAQRGGIVVDDALQTSDPRIFAIGECAVHRGVHYGLVAPGYEMADVAGAAARRRGRPVRGSRPLGEAQAARRRRRELRRLLRRPRAARTRPARSCSRTAPRASTRSSSFDPELERLLGGILVGDASAYLPLLSHAKTGTAGPAHIRASCCSARRARRPRRARRAFPTRRRSAPATTSAKGDLVARDRRAASSRRSRR